ncbi:hypothetical protein JNO48_10200 [Clostridiales bacterium]|nr:hypothetical protein JNO48_10200 [Clostridiales bacterium]
MKKTIALTLSIVLVLASLSCFAQAEEGPKFVTIQEWMDAKGECGDCMLLLKVIQVLNPVVALAADETGTVNLFSGANDPESFVAFFDEEKGMLDGYILVIANPKYNPYEGTIEMANWTLLRILPNLEAE